MNIIPGYLFIANVPSSRQKIIPFKNGLKYMVHAITPHDGKFIYSFKSSEPQTSLIIKEFENWNEAELFINRYSN